MRSRRARPGLALAALFLALGQAAHAETDALGEKIAEGASPSRIVTLAPSLAELAAALAPEHLERIVGVSEYTDFPTGLSKAERIGPYNRFNLEKVAALRPDLVLATKDGNAEDQIHHLKELGLNVRVVDTTSLALVARSMRQVGLMTGNAAAGERMARAFEQGVEQVRLRARNRPKRRVMLVLGDEPLIVAGGQAFLSEALSTIGAVNAYTDSPARYPRPSMEDALARDPDAVVILAMGDPKPFQKMQARWESFAKLRAVKSQRVKLIHADTLVRPTLRLLDGLLLLEEAVYGP
jgi:iron complex transport system substrate-binding protein